MKLMECIVFYALASTLVLAGGTDTEIALVEDHNGWGWTAVVMQNGLVTLATMPDIGAHIMQYDLGSHSSMYVNPAMIGKVQTPTQSGSWLNYGGYKVWPAPQSRWNWIPPVQLDVGKYAHEIVDQTADSVSVFVRSPQETWNVHPWLPGLVFERRTVLFRGSSRVKLEQSILNTTANEMSWSVWDVTQAIVHHLGETDYENFWIYFPIKKEGSVFGAKGVKTSASSQAWKGEVAPGVYGVQFRPEGKKIFADSPEGWIAYVDEREGYAYFKVFEIWEGADYPDDGARNEVWINNNPAYVEVEVVSPIWPIAPGGKITFVEEWYAAKMFGPVLTANHVGAIRKRLAYRDGATTLTATYGVFHEGTARIVFLDENDGLLVEGAVHEVTPLQEFEVAESLEMPTGAKTVQVRVHAQSGELLGAVESKNVDQLTSVATPSSLQPVLFSLAQNYPNPFNAATAIEYAIAREQRVRLTIFAMNGREVATLVDDVAAPGAHRVVWHAGSAPAGIYVARLEGEGESATKKMILLK